MTVLVTEPPQSETAGAVPLGIIAVVAIVIAAAGFLGIVWLNRRQRSFPEMFNGSNGTTE